MIEIKIYLVLYVKFKIIKKVEKEQKNVRLPVFL